MSPKPRTIDGYLASVSREQRAALMDLRRTIRAAAPEAEECISYGVPSFRLDGRPLVAFGASARHCSFYPMSASTVEAHREELEGYDTSKGTIRFQPDRPIPAGLVRKMVRERIAETAGRSRAGRGGSTCRPARPGRAEPRRAQTDPAVIEFLSGLDHPLKKGIEAVRGIILGASPEIREGIKWNAPSFRTTEFFATIGVRARDCVQLIFHMGAKVKDNSTAGMRIADPEGLLDWRARERCLVTFRTEEEIEARRSALEAIVRGWIRQL